MNILVTLCIDIHDKYAFSIVTLTIVTLTAMYEDR